MKYKEAGEDLKAMKKRTEKNITHDELRAAYSYIAEQYNEFALGAFGAVAYKQTADRVLAQLPAGKARLLDVGCGTGVLASHIHEAHPLRAVDLDIVGCDYTPAMLTQAKKTGHFSALYETDVNEPFELIVDSGDRKGSSEGLFDAIAVSGVFFEGHSVKPVALVNILDHLKPGGVACISFRKPDLSTLGEDNEMFIEKSNCEIISCEVALYRHAVPEIPQPEMHGFFVVVRKRT